jgi:hypothetical protein
MAGHPKRAQKSPQHLPWLGLRKEKVEKTAKWFEVIAGLSKFDSSMPGTVEALRQPTKEEHGTSWA